MRAARLSESALLGAAFRTDTLGADALTKLARYETSLERSLERAGVALEQRQAARREREQQAALAKRKAGSLMAQALRRGVLTGAGEAAE